MVDRIAPKKPELIAATKQLGVDEGGNSPVPTVATELYRYLVIQETDSKGRPAFPYGRPAWELVEGVLMVDDVEPYSKMKSLLVNSAAHSCSALIGAWGGFGHVHEVMANPQLGPFFKKLITVDTFAAVPKPNDFDTRTYADDVVLRVSNPTMQDELKRLLPNASKQRVAARVVPLLDALLTTPNVDISRGALAYAAWLALDRHGKDWLGRAVPGQIEADPERKDNDARHAAASASVGMAFEDSPVEIGDKAKQRALAQATFKAFHDKPGVLTDSLRRNEQFGRTVVDQLAELYRDTPAAVAAKYTGAA
jgi:mannitol-1-phosphate/altronate dehydrogenase